MKRILFILTPCLILIGFSLRSNLFNSNNYPLDPLEGKKGFLEAMGYVDEHSPMKDPAIDYSQYHNYDTFGEDILLIINYNHPYYKNNDFLRKLYSPFFPNIVFFGPTSGPDIHSYDAQYGAWGHRAIAMAMEMYPNYQGYLFLEDDCVFHFWNMVRFDKNKIWIGDKNNRRIYHFNEKARWSNWNHDYYGCNKLQNAMQKISLRHRKMLEKNIGQNAGLGGMADIIYFPARFKNEVIKLAHLFANELVFIEIALPTITACLDEEKNWESLHGRWGYLDEYNPCLDFVHPIKFSVEENRTFIQNLFEQQSEKNCKS